MKSLGILCLFTALITSGLASSDFSFRGEISDSQCAMNVHSLSRSHKEMTSKHTMGCDAASCAKFCVRKGGEWVLRSEAVVYRLKNQSGLEQFAAQKVEVTGTLDTKTNTIDNIRIEGAPKQRRPQ